MYTIDQFVRNSVIYSMTPLVSTLLSPEAQDARAHLVPCELGTLIDQAVDLAYPIQDYEEAALGLGYYQKEQGWYHDTITPAYCETAQDVCDQNCADPYYWEVYEYWAVNECLSRHLILQGEKVDTDFAGFHVWARTTTGQSISLDDVIIRIYRELTSARAGG